MTLTFYTTSNKRVERKPPIKTGKENNITSAGLEKYFAEKIVLGEIF